MRRYVIRRLLLSLLLVMVASSAALLLTRLAPGDVSVGLGPDATRRERDDARRRFALDENPATQWMLWIGRAARLDFGESILYNRPVGPMVIRAAGNTAILGIAALTLALVLGVGLGIVSGSGRDGAAAAIVRAVSLVAISMPPLLTSLLLVFVATRTGLAAPGSMTAIDASDLSIGGRFLDLLRHLPVPALALALPVAASFERLQSQALRAQLREPYITAAAARGVAPDALVLHHAWPASLRTICATFGLAVGALLSGSFAVEYVTAWPGLGRLMFDALRARDIYLITGSAAVGAALLSVGMLAGDLLLAFVDPRVTEGGQ